MVIENNALFLRSRLGPVLSIGLALLTYVTCREEMNTGRCRKQRTDSGWKKGVLRLGITTICCISPPSTRIKSHGSPPPVTTCHAVMRRTDTAAAYHVWECVCWEQRTGATTVLFAICRMLDRLYDPSPKGPRSASRIVSWTWAAPIAILDLTEQGHSFMLKNKNLSHRKACETFSSYKQERSRLSDPQDRPT